MNKKKIILIPVIIGIGFLFLLVMYFAIGIYYKNSFMIGTFVNDIYCTGKSIEQVNDELISDFSLGEVTIKDSNGNEYEISLDSLDYSVDYKGQLANLLDTQDAVLWITNLSSGSKKTIEPVIYFDTDKLREVINKCGIIEDNEKENTVKICLQDGYTLYDGMKHVLNKEKLYQYVEEQINLSKTEIDISDCYSDLPYTKEMEDTYSLWRKVSEFQDCRIVYDMGDEKVSLGPKITYQFIKTDENGEFILDESGNLILSDEGIADFIDNLCNTYDTFETERVFHATRGEDVVVSGGTYGNKIDRNKEITYLKEAFPKKIAEAHIPSYEKLAFVRGKNDIGDTYVEIDMGTQKLYYYEKGKLIISTDIVTGNIGRKMDTPAGVNYIYYMQKNRTLRGENYTSFVKYWAAVKGAIGIHDASWRKEFGGEIYKKNGSHGCVNVPRETMADLYDRFELGIPVVMFY